MDAYTVELLAARSASPSARRSASSWPLVLLCSPVLPMARHLRYPALSRRNTGALPAGSASGALVHSLRHYSATELLTAGVDLRTVAGRLGHGSGGATTLRFYAAWVSEADHRAADAIGNLMSRPTPRTDPDPPQNPYELLAAELRRGINSGELALGLPLPTCAELATKHGVSAGTVNRAIAVLKKEGLSAGSAGSG